MKINAELLTVGVDSKNKFEAKFTRGELLAEYDNIMADIQYESHKGPITNFVIEI